MPICVGCLCSGFVGRGISIRLAASTRLNSTACSTQQAYRHPGMYQQNNHVLCLTGACGVECTVRDQVWAHLHHLRLWQVGNRDAGSCTAAVSSGQGLHATAEATCQPPVPIHHVRWGDGVQRHRLSGCPGAGPPKGMEDATEGETGASKASLRSWGRPAAADAHGEGRRSGFLARCRAQAGACRIPVQAARARRQTLAGQLGRAHRQVT